MSSTSNPSSEDDREATVEDWMEVLPPRDQWVETDHNRVYKTYEHNPPFGGNFVTAGKVAAEMAPDWDVVITIQRYISTYDIAYVADWERGLIHIRCYATALINPEYIKDMGEKIKREYSEFNEDSTPNTG